MSQKESLLASIREEQSADDLRLLYAEWIKNNENNEDRGIFIQVQIALAGGVNELGLSHAELREREQVLMTRENMERWMADDGMPGGGEIRYYSGPVSGFERGFAVLRHRLPRGFNILEFDHSRDIPADAPERQYYGVRGRPYIDLPHHIPRETTGEINIPAGLEALVRAEQCNDITSMSVAEGHKGDIYTEFCQDLTKINIGNRHSGDLRIESCAKLARIDTGYWHNGDLVANHCNSLTSVNTGINHNGDIKINSNSLTSISTAPGHNGNLETAECHSLISINTGVGHQGGVHIHICQSLTNINIGEGHSGRVSIHYAPSLTSINFPAGNEGEIYLDTCRSLTSLTTATGHNGRIAIIDCDGLASINTATGHKGDIWVETSHALTSIALANDFDGELCIEKCDGLSSIKFGAMEIDLKNPRIAKLEIMNLIRDGQMPNLGAININRLIVIDKKEIYAARPSGRA